MRRHLATPLSLIVLTGSLLGWLAAVPIVSAGDPCYHGFTMPPATAASNARVTLMPCAFSPTVTQADVGETVTFANGTDFTHLVTGANQAWGSRDVEVPPGATVSYRFDHTGVYPYACALHRGMAGVILVGDTSAVTTVGGSGATGSATTPGAEAQAGPPDARLILLAVLAGALIGGLVVEFASRRSAARGTESTGGVAG